MVCLLISFGGYCRWYQSKGEYAGFDGHHVFKTSRPAVEYGIIHGYTTLTNTQTATSNIEPYATHGTSTVNGPVVVYMKFEAGEDVTVATACSFINADKAEINLNEELASSRADMFNLEQVAESAGSVWEQQLSTITVSTTADLHTTQYDSYANNTIVLYTSLWHSLLLPRVVSDADGAYLKFTDGERTVQYTQPQVRLD